MAPNGCLHTEQVRQATGAEAEQWAQDLNGMCFWSRGLRFFFGPSNRQKNPQFGPKMDDVGLWDFDTVAALERTAPRVRRASRRPPTAPRRLRCSLVAGMQMLHDWVAAGGKDARRAACDARPARPCRPRRGALPRAVPRRPTPSSSRSSTATRTRWTRTSGRRTGSSSAARACRRPSRRRCSARRESVSVFFLKITCTGARRRPRPR